MDGRDLGDAGRSGRSASGLGMPTDSVLLLPLCTDRGSDRPQ